MPESEKRQFLPRGRKLVILIAVVVVAVLAGVGGWLWWQNRDKPDKSNSKSEPSVFDSIAHTGDVNFDSSIDVAGKIDYYISEAWILQNANRSEDALNMLREGEKLAENGAYPQLYAAFGDLYALQNNKTEARKYYNKAIDQVDASNLPDKDSFKEAYKEQLNNL